MSRPKCHHSAHSLDQFMNARYFLNSIKYILILSPMILPKFNNDYAGLIEEILENSENDFISLEKVLLDPVFLLK